MQMRIFTMLLGFCGLVGCHEPLPLLYASLQVKGTALLSEPKNAEVILRSTESDFYLTTTTDKSGRFHFSFEGKPGIFEIWVDDETLGTLVQLEHEEPKDIAVTPLTTLLYDITKARSETFEPITFLTSLNSMMTHLSFDPIHTHFDGLGIEPEGRHALALKTLKNLAIRKNVTFSSLFSALRRDAQGLSPAGVFDGLGASGPIVWNNQYLSADLLRTDFISSLYEVLANTGITPNSIDFWVKQLACSDSDLFLECVTPPPPIDPSEPYIENIFPPLTEILHGKTDITVIAVDPESGLSEIQLFWEPLDRWEEIPSAAFSENTAVFQLDTSVVQGKSEIPMRIIATNQAHIKAIREFAYRVDNIGENTLSGIVFKGPTKNARVIAQGFYDGIDLKNPFTLGEAVTDDSGDFTIQISEYKGPIFLTASAMEGTASLDEAWDAWILWRETAEMVTLLPYFDTTHTQVLVSPFGDLAWHLALAKNDTNVFSEYIDALNSLAGHFDVMSYLSLVQTRPESAQTMHYGPLIDASHMMLALMCFSQQAAEIGEKISPAWPQNFTALDLLNLYRKDAIDGLLDGRLYDSAVTYEVSSDYIFSLPVDDFRQMFAFSCMKALQSEHNYTGITTASISDFVISMIQNQNGYLFGNEEHMSVERLGPSVDFSLNLECSKGTIAELTTQDEPFELNETLTVPRDFHFSVATEDMFYIDSIVATSNCEILNVDQAINEAYGSLNADVHCDFDGPVTISITSTDWLGDSKTVHYGLRADGTLPTLTSNIRLSGNPGESDSENNLYLNWDVTESGPFELVIKIDEQIVDRFETNGDQSCEENYPIRHYQDGLHTLTLDLNDAQCNQVHREHTFLLDHFAPSVSVVPTFYENHTNWNPLGDCRSNCSPVRVLPGQLNLVERWQGKFSRESEELPIIELQIQDIAVSSGKLLIERQIDAQPPVIFEQIWSADENVKIQISADADANEDLPGEILWDLLSDTVERTVQYSITACDTNQCSTPLKFKFILTPLGMPLLISSNENFETPGVISPSELSLENGSIQGLFHHGNGTALGLRHVSIINPHEIDVLAKLRFPSISMLTAELERRVESIKHFSNLQLKEIPACLLYYNTQEVVALNPVVNIQPSLMTEYSITADECEMTHEPLENESFVTNITLSLDDTSNEILIPAQSTVSFDAYLPASVDEIDISELTACEENFRDYLCAQNAQSDFVAWRVGVNSNQSMNLYTIHLGYLLLQFTGFSVFTPGEWGVKPILPDGRTGVEMVLPPLQPIEDSWREIGTSVSR